MASIGQKRQITRHRDHLSCVECRRKKLRCDRAAPCSACTRRDGGVSCSYQTSTTGFEAEREHRRKAEGRLGHLEQMVQQLSESPRSQLGPLSNGAKSSAATTVLPDSGVAVENSGVTSSTPPASSGAYNGATHWSAMLEDIEELKYALSMNGFGSQRTYSSQEATNIDDISILFGAGPTLTFEQVLTKYLPSRQEADRLVGTYFRTKAVKAPFLHHSQFQRVYLAFWTSPLATSALWVSMLFSIFHASITSLNPTSSFENRYATAAAHCLTLGKHHQPRQYAVEGLLLYTQVKCFTQVDVDADIGSLLGMVTRSAIRMGYHRDPARLAISPYEKEMRRRVWSTLLQLELLISFQLGLPSSILPGSHDTHIPANLQDADFDEATVNMPPRRPYTEDTDVMFYVAKHLLSTAFEKVHQHVSTVNSNKAYADFAIEALDAEVRQTFLSLPTQYRQKPVSASVFDSATLIVARFCVVMIYEKCLCVLHRPYVAAGRKESVLACYVSSSNIIRHFVDAYKEFRPDGQVATQRWFMSAITWHDFLLGVTALCLVICSASRHNMLSAIDVQDAIALLRSAQSVLEHHSAQSRDTYQVQKVVETVLRRFGGPSPPGIDDLNGSAPSASSQSQTGAAATTNGFQEGMSDTSLPAFNAAEFDWTSALSQQPMVDESWNWLEQMLADDTLFENTPATL